MGPRLSLGGRVDVVYPSDLIATRIVSVFMSVWFSFFFVDLRCFTSRSETLGPRTTTGVSQRWFSGHFRQVFFNTNALPRINIGADVWGESGIMTGVYSTMVLVAPTCGANRAS